MRVEKLEQVFLALNQARVRYLVAGGLAVLADGGCSRRVTTDLDLVIQLVPDNIVHALEALGALGYGPKVPVRALELADPGKREGWIRDKGMVVFPLVSDEFRSEPIDVFVDEPFPFESVYARAEWMPFGAALLIPVVPRRELCEMKIAAGRAQDLVDLDLIQAHTVPDAA